MVIDRSSQAWRRVLVMAVAFLLLPLGWIPGAATAHEAPHCPEPGLGAAEAHGACPQHECCLGAAEAPAPRPTGTPGSSVTAPSPAPRDDALTDAVLALPATPPAAIPIARAHGPGLPLRC